MENIVLAGKKRVRFSEKCTVHRMMTKTEYDRTATKRLRASELKKQEEFEQSVENGSSNSGIIEINAIQLIEGDTHDNVRKRAFIFEKRPEIIIIGKIQNNQVSSG